MDDWIERRGWVRPDYGGACFASLPGTIEQLLSGATARPALGAALLEGLHARYERIALVYLDAFGCEHARRHEDHPLLIRAAQDGLTARLTAQFPSTTTAHITTIHMGLPVYEHGLYEWRMLEPAFDRLISPLPFAFAGAGAPSLPDQFAAERLYPGRTLYEDLAGEGISSVVLGPRRISASRSSAAFAKGTATQLAFDTVGVGLTELARALNSLAPPAYALAYIDSLDALQHAAGPPGAERGAVNDELVALLDAIEHQLLGRLAPGTLLLVSSDHGMAPTPPSQTVYLNRGEHAEEIIDCVRAGRDGHPLAPAGSSRDLFLHVRDGCIERLVEALAALLGERAEVRTKDELIAAGLFGAAPSQRLLERLGDVAVLPVFGESVFWYTPGRFVQTLSGNHGGLTPQEMEIPLLALQAA